MLLEIDIVLYKQKLKMPRYSETWANSHLSNNGRYNSVTASINLTFIGAPLSNGRFFQVQWVAIVHRFDCILIFKS